MYRITHIFKHGRPYLRFLRQFSLTSFSILGWGSAVVLLNSHVVETTLIDGPSMYPSLNADYHSGLGRDRCLVSKWNPREGLERGMIVTFW